MSTSIVLGNGNMLVNLDERLQMTDLFWPKLGKDNHLMGHHIRSYFWDYGNLVSLEDKDAFHITAAYEKDSLCSRSVIESAKFGIRILVQSTILPHKDIYVCKYTITNNWDMNRNLKFFINHDFYLKGYNVGDTACWYPHGKMLFHYKDNTYMGVGSASGLSQYNCGRSHSSGGSGTLPDVTTGKLAGNAIEYGAVESTLGFDIDIGPGEVKTFDYFIICGENIDSCVVSKNYIDEQGLDHLLNDTENFWRSYLTTALTSLEKENEIDWENLLPDKELSIKVRDNFIRSVGVVRTQIDNGGAVIAANDSAHVKYRKDTYGYLWHRDASLTISSLDSLGFTTLSEKYFKLCKKLLQDDGYFLHMYNANGTLGSSWHPWIDGQGNPQLPIQEDETATTLWALWQHYERHQNHELISELWEDLIKPAAEFLCDYRYLDTGENIKFLEKTFQDNYKDIEKDSFTGTKLPMSSYDLWEEKRGIFTYTCSSVYGGLLGASILALKLGQHDEAEKYSKAAFEIKNATIKYLYDEEEGHFIHALFKNDSLNSYDKSTRIDSSICGIWFFDMLPVDDIRVVNTMNWLETELWNKNNIGGILRYKNDDYYRRDQTQDGNPWYITTLWIAQYYIKRNEVENSMKYLRWVIDNTRNTGLMGEQIDCSYGEDLSVLPLTWSHAEFIRTVTLLTQI